MNTDGYISTIDRVLRRIQPINHLLDKVANRFMLSISLP